MPKLMSAILAAFMMMSVAMAVVSVDISPKFVRLPINQSKTFDVRLVGEGKLYDVRAYGTGLSWTEKSIWAGSYGKSETITFTPTRTGDFTITVEMDDESGSTEVTVFSYAASTLLKKIDAAREQVETPADQSKLAEVERLFNESKFNLAEMELDELLANLQVPTQQQTSSLIPQIILVLILLVALIVVAKFVI